MHCISNRKTFHSVCIFSTISSPTSLSLKVNSFESFLNVFYCVARLLKLCAVLLLPHLLFQFIAGCSFVSASWLNRGLSTNESQMHSHSCSGNSHLLHKNKPNCFQTIHGFILFGVLKEKQVNNEAFRGIRSTLSRCLLLI